ncbi:MAG TPA: LysR family transcriptional regulator, partial [Ramlibacter sp.]|nr:LysR family transcriptional regulator [Ramlibacter sp.]
MPSARDALTPDALTLLKTVARSGSFAAAARELALVPSAVTYRVRQVEEALDVLLFDRSSRQARLTDAGSELLREGGRLLLEIDAVANRVRRVATGWEAQLTIAVDTAASAGTVMELAGAFFELAPPTRLRLRDETLSGTLAAVVGGQADLAIGVTLETGTTAGLQSRPLGDVAFVFAVAPHHALAAAPEPLADDLVRRHRAVAVADSVPHGGGQTVGLLPGQDVLTLPTMRAKLDAQLRGLGAGFVPEPMA